MSNALKAGYRHLDFAMMYGNQAEIGEALTATFKEGKVKREDVWMTSKVISPRLLTYCSLVRPFATLVQGPSPPEHWL